MEKILSVFPEVHSKILKYPKRCDQKSKNQRYSVYKTISRT